jgi:hypothetical protein
VSLLTNSAGTTLDTSVGNPTSGNYYVTSVSNGGFSISGDYTCVPNSQVYLYALGGNPEIPLFWSATYNIDRYGDRHGWFAATLNNDFTHGEVTKMTMDFPTSKQVQL